MSSLKRNNSNLQILTDTGFVDFEGISTMGVQQLYEVEFTDNTSIEVTDKHGFFTLDGRDIATRELSVGLQLLGTTEKQVSSITKTSKKETYDIIESTGHTYVTNGVLSHNCIFLSSDALLINSLYLTNLSDAIDKIHPKRNIKGVTFWDDIKPGETYLLGVDPATGNGNDFSVITIFHFPSMVQVGEYRSNTMSTNDLYGMLKNILTYISQQHTTVYFSVENNGVGEGVIALFEADEHPPDGEFVSEEGKNKLGMTTTSRTKMRACVNLKELLEKNNMHIKSRVLLAELKSYVRHKGSYAAQTGSTDDAISAVLIIIRLLGEISSYEQGAYDKLYASESHEQWKQSDYDGYDGDYDDDDEGLPIIV